MTFPCRQEDVDKCVLFHTLPLITSQSKDLHGHLRALQLMGGGWHATLNRICTEIRNILMGRSAPKIPFGNLWVISHFRQTYGGFKLSL